MTKDQWRSRLRATRRTRSAADIARARRLTTAHLVTDLTRLDPGSTVATYLPLPHEPLSAGLAAGLAAHGLRILVPVTRHDKPMRWSDISESLRTPPVAGDLGRPVEQQETTPVSVELARGMLGILEPTGPTLPPDAIRSAAAVLVPALAVDTAGTRLGRGGGYYDRTLAPIMHAGSGTGPRLIAVTFDDEVFDHRTDPLPREEHDVPMTEFVTPACGLRHVAISGVSGA